MNPAMAGPEIVATLKTTIPRLTAFWKTSVGTRFGINDWRAGISNAVAADGRQLSRWIGQTLFNPPSVAAVRPAAESSVVFCRRHPQRLHRLMNRQLSATHEIDQLVPKQRPTW